MSVQDTYLGVGEDNQSGFLQPEGSLRRRLNRCSVSDFRGEAQADCNVKGTQNDIFLKLGHLRRVLQNQCSQHLLLWTCCYWRKYTHMCTALLQFSEYLDGVDSLQRTGRSAVVQSRDHKHERLRVTGHGRCRQPNVAAINH